MAVIVGFLVLLIIAIPISMSMMGASMIPVLAGSNIITLKSLLIDAFAGSDSTPILAVPLFILAGVIMSEGGISKKLFNVFAYIVGSIPGGLPCASIITA
ncbi:MAG: TRAP transporter large permease subunit [Muribaculaceae bacterium]|nr:TRAP transporter large permease subunit [Muribaculaceae bacterium]